MGERETLNMGPVEVPFKHAEVGPDARFSGDVAVTVAIAGVPVEATPQCLYAPPAGFEPATKRLEGSCLGYFQTCICHKSACFRGFMRDMMSHVETRGCYEGCYMARVGHVANKKRGPKVIRPSSLSHIPNHRQGSDCDESYTDHPEKTHARGDNERGHVVRARQKQINPMRGTN